MVSTVRHIEPAGRKESIMRKYSERSGVTAAKVDNLEKLAIAVFAIGYSIYQAYVLYSTLSPAFRAIARALF